MDDIFSQKKVNHIFHYTQTFDTLVKIITTGFAPSYCEEQIGDLIYLIPMVSFCNISIGDVSLYMRYGNYGIGMTMEWAIKNGISPVIYVHENSPFAGLHKQINEILLWDLVHNQLASVSKQIEDSVSKGTSLVLPLKPEPTTHSKLLADVNNLTVPTLQFFKNWKTNYKGNEIITYQEREWRYIPQLKGEKRIIESSDSDFEKFNDKEVNPKPHLPSYKLGFDSISDLKYVLIKEENERDNILSCLFSKFGQENVIVSIVGGKLLILTDEQIKNDF